jgi:signal transduction histidine kinase
MKMKTNLGGSSILGTKAELAASVSWLGEIFKTVLPAACAALNVSACWLHSVGDEGREMVLSGSCGIAPEMLLEVSRTEAYRTFARRALAGAEATIVKDISADSKSLFTSFSQGHFHSLVFVPVKQEDALGLFVAVSGEPDFAPQTISILTALGKVVTIALCEAIDRRWTEQFINVVVHELKTPLTPILASGELLAEELGTSQGVLLELVTNILAGAQRMDARLSELLSLARIRAGTLEINRAPVDLARLIRDVASQYRPVSQRKGQRLDLEIRSPLPIVKADRQRLEQIMLNLLSNASKFAPEGGWIRIRAMPGNHDVVVEVQDNGSGISKEEQRRLFRPYYRGEVDRQRFPGVGLGLALSKQLVELHGGQMGLKSEIGKGSIFYFSLPIEVK